MPFFDSERSKNRALPSFALALNWGAGGWAGIPGVDAPESAEAPLGAPAFDESPPPEHAASTELRRSTREARAGEGMRIWV